MMKKIILLFSLLAILKVIIAETPKIGIHSVADFEKTYKEKVYPFDKISDTTFQRLRSEITFDEEGHFRGFNFIGGLRKELTFKEYQKFNELISGVKIKYTKEDEEEYNRRKNLK